MTNFITAVTGLTVGGKRRKLPKIFNEKAERVRKALMHGVPLSQKNQMRTELRVCDVVEFSAKNYLNSLQSCDFCRGDFAPWNVLYKAK